MSVPTQITFFEKLCPLVASGLKTITIRDESENNYQPNSVVEVYTLETNLKVCEIRILSVEPLKFEQINEFHAKQEALPLGELKTLIKDVYPSTNDLFMIKFELV
ncbi:N(4)-acetylcytidine aminohydrolase [Parashewanella tropica]|uniref:N(4)-acetylcytidine aminohydrolase n=1 Tax=Parashewanella tropica TaxID=2547970 RepID=UPI001059CE08|nr:N(4)-acetylcytidine aminohydrolase [Parashewanella tropica]